MAELTPGTRFGGDYEILRVLGAGGMATVYEAREEPIGRVVALKVLDRAEPALRTRFLAEARTMAALRHPGLAQILRFGTDPATGIPFLAMKSYPRTLADRLAGSRALAEADAAALGLRLADALAALHAADPPVVHRDLKPSNVLLDESGAPVLSDFGVAKRLAPDETQLTLASLGGQPGTWAWAAPEQRAGLPPTPAADWHAFGLLLYRCLTGGLPAPGGELPLDIAATVSRAWRPLLRGLLRDDPGARLADPDAIRAALRRVLRSVRRRAALRRLRAPLAALALAALLVAGAVSAARRARTAGDAAQAPAEDAAAPHADAGPAEVPTLAELVVAAAAEKRRADWPEGGDPPFWPRRDPKHPGSWSYILFDHSFFGRVASPPEIGEDGVARIGPRRTVVSRDVPQDGSVREVLLDGGQLVFYDPDRADEPDHFPLPVRVTAAGGYLRTSNLSETRCLTNSISGDGTLHLDHAIVAADAVSGETRLDGNFRKAEFDEDGQIVRYVPLDGRR